MNGSSSTTSSFSPLASAPCSTSLTAPLSALERSRTARPAGGCALYRVIGPGRPAAYRPSSAHPRKLEPFAAARGTMSAARFARGARAMQVLETFLDAMGNTPLVRLNAVTRGLAPTILAKLEMLNPGGSVKDRIGIRMIEDAERRGLLGPGGTFVEPSSDNTGHGVAIAAAIRGYRCIFVMPD